jgi:hypothetical protein
MTQHLSKHPEREELDQSPNRAHLSFKAGRVEFNLEVNITPAGLISIGGLVSMILLSIAPIIRASKSKVPRRNEDTRHRP